MWKRENIYWALLLIVLALAPWPDTPFRYVKWEDKLKTSPVIALLYGHPCTSYVNHTYFTDSSPDCLVYDEERYYKGIWIYQFEGSYFYENAKTVPQTWPYDEPPYKKSSWLDYERANIFPDLANLPGDYDPDKECYVIKAFSVSFIGRKYRGLSGLWSSRILPTRNFKLEILPPPDCATYNKYRFDQTGASQ
jgi:hypothetical protein